MSNGDDGLREAAVRAIGTWNVASLQNQLVEVVGAADTPRAVRAAAIDALVRNGGAQGRRVVETLTETGAAPEVQARVLAALLEADQQGTTPRFVAWLGRLAPDQYRRGRDPAWLRVLELRGAPAFWPRPLSDRAGVVRRFGQALHSPGPSVGPRRAEADRGS